MVYIKRSPEPTSGEETETTNAYAHDIVESVPKSTIALAAIVSVFGLVFLTFCVVWRIRARRRRRNGVFSLDSSKLGNYSSSEKRGDLESSANIEKPEKAFAPAEVTPYLGTTGWIPQIRTYHGIPIKQLPKEVQVSLEERKLKGAIDTHSFVPSERTPPPAYVVTNGGAERESSLRPSTPPSIPLPPIPPTTAEIPPTPPTPPANNKLKIPQFLTSRFSADTPILSPGAAIEPLPSPIRNESFHRQQRLHPAVLPSFKPSKSKKSQLPLPRVMTVTNTFTPSRDDELPIRISETVRMLEEYRDGWCLVQSTDEDDAPQGVVPRSCLVERQTVIPAFSPSRHSRFPSTSGGKF